MNYSLSPSEEMALALIDTDTKTAAKEFLLKNKEAELYEKYNMSFRFLRTSDQNVNFEVLSMIDAPNGGMISFFKPIGFYTFEKGILGTKIIPTIVREFESELDKLRVKGVSSANSTFGKLSLAQNALMAVFSTEALLNASKRKDATFRANGLDVEILISSQGNPQFFLEDKYGFSDGIAVFTFTNGQVSMDPSLNLKETYDWLRKMQLLSVFKRIK